MKKGLIASLAALIIIVCLLFAALSDLKANPEMPKLQWSKSYTGDGAVPIIQSPDGGFAIVGHLQSFSN